MESKFLSTSLRCKLSYLASIGSKIEGDKLGFGVNLFSGEKTLCEWFSEEYINSEIMARNKQYEYMEFIQE